LGTYFPCKIAHTHNNKTKSLAITKHRPKPKIVKTTDYNCGHVMIMAVPIIFPVIPQTVINLRMLSIGGQAYNCGTVKDDMINTTSLAVSVPYY